MKMITHDDVAEQLPVVADDRVLEAVDQPMAVPIVGDDLLPGIAPRHHVRDGTRKLNPKSPWPGVRLKLGIMDRQAENKLLSLTPRSRPEPQGLVLLGREHGVEEDAAEGHLGPPLVAEGVSDGDPDDPAGDQVGQDQRGQDEAQVVPLPDRRVEHGVGGVVMPRGRQLGGEPDFAEGARPLTDDPPGEQCLEGGEDAGMEAVAERLYQGGERGDKLG